MMSSFRLKSLCSVLGKSDTLEACQCRFAQKPCLSGRITRLGFGFHFPVCFLRAGGHCWMSFRSTIPIDHNNEISMHSSISFPKQTKSPTMFYRYHDLKRMEREQQRLEQQASSSACSSTPLGDDLGTNEFRPTDGVKTSNQKQAVGEVAPRRISLDTSELQQTSSSSKTTAVSTSKAQHTTEHPLQKLHVPKKRRIKINLSRYFLAVWLCRRCFVNECTCANYFRLGAKFTTMK